MRHMQSEIISIADACLGGLKGRSALLIGPAELRHPYKTQLHEAGMKTIFQEENYSSVSAILPQIQLLMNMPASYGSSIPLLTAASIAVGCIGRHTPLLIFDLAASTSVEELAGLLPPVCLYTPDDLRHVLYARPNTHIA